MSYRRLWIALALVLVISFAVLGGVGIKLLNNAPPIPSQVVTTDGTALFSGEDIRDGQNVWQSIGGQEVVRRRNNAAQVHILEPRPE